MTEISKLESQAQTRFLHYLLGKKDPEEFILLLERYYKLFPEFTIQSPVRNLTSTKHAQPVTPLSAVTKPSAKVETPAKDLADKASKISKPLPKVSQPKSAVSSASVRRTIRRAFHSILHQEPVRGLLIKKDKIAELRLNPLKVLSRTAGYTKLFSSTLLGDITVKQFRHAMKVFSTEPSDELEQPKTNTSSEAVSKPIIPKSSKTLPIPSSEKSILTDSPIEEEQSLSRAHTTAFLHGASELSSPYNPFPVEEASIQEFVLEDTPPFVLDKPFVLEPTTKIDTPLKTEDLSLLYSGVDSRQQDPTLKAGSLSDIGTILLAPLTIPKLKASPVLTKTVPQGASPLSVVTPFSEVVAIPEANMDASDYKRFEKLVCIHSVQLQKVLTKSPFGKIVDAKVSLDMKETLAYCKTILPLYPNYLIRLRAHPITAEKARDSLRELLDHNSILEKQ